jgi:hypothetical protein
LLLAFAILTLAVYAVIAAGRAPLNAGKRLVRAYGAAHSRYHHVATIPLTAILCLLLARLAAAVALAPRARTALLVVWLTAAAGLYATGSWRVDRHLRDRAATERIVSAIDRTIRTVPMGQVVLFMNRKFPPAVFHKAFAGWAALFTIFFPTDVGRRVYFVEPDPAVRAMARRGSRLAAVLIPSVQVPAAPR